MGVLVKEEIVNKEVIDKIEHICSLFNGVLLINGKEVDMDSFDLSGYTPEVISESNFEPFKYKGPVRVNYARFENALKASEFYGTEVASKLFSIEIEILEGDHAKRKLWKRFYVASSVEDKKGKTPAKKLADQLFLLGLEFSNEDQLGECALKLVDMSPSISAYYFKADDGKMAQVWNFMAGKTEAVATSAGSIQF